MMEKMREGNRKRKEEGHDPDWWKRKDLFPLKQAYRIAEETHELLNELALSKPDKDKVIREIADVINCAVITEDIFNGKQG